MTEYEMGEMLYNAYGQMWEAAQMYFTLVSAYLVVAYLVGKKLTRIQLSIITVLFLLWTIGCINTQLAAGIGAIELGAEMESLFSRSIGGATSPVVQAGTFGFTVVMTCGIFASLFFMWHVRHAQIE